jgi:hypothetical protein
VSNPHDATGNNGLKGIRVAKIVVKQGDWESACAELRSALKTQDEEFAARIAESLSGKKQPAAEAEPAPVPAPVKKLPPSAPSYQTLLSKRRR